MEIRKNCQPIVQIHENVLEFITFLIISAKRKQKGAEGSQRVPKVKKNRKTVKVGIPKGDNFHKNCLCFAIVFSLIFGGVLRSVFFTLVAEVSQMGATWGHFSSHVAAKLESWKLGFRVHQTLLFRVSRGWVRTSWATFSNIFSGMGFET